MKHISKKQAAELKTRRDLKTMIGQSQFEVSGWVWCETCGRDTPCLDLSHIIALSRGGKTTRDNCILECRNCHNLYEKRPETRPIDSIGYLKWKKQTEG